jgi:hypothetical protein
VKDQGSCWLRAVQRLLQGEQDEPGAGSSAISSPARSIRGSLTVQHTCKVTCRHIDLRMPLQLTFGCRAIHSDSLRSSVRASAAALACAWRLAARACRFCTAANHIQMRRLRSSGG